MPGIHSGDLPKQRLEEKEQRLLFPTLNLYEDITFYVIRETILRKNNKDYNFILSTFMRIPHLCDMRHNLEGKEQRLLKG